MKWAIRILLVVVLLVVVGLAAAYFYADSIAKQAVERGGAYATGVPTTVDDVSLGLFAGEAGLEGLQIDNPEGFDSEFFLQLGEAQTSVSLGTLMDDTVVVPRLHLDAIHLNLERKGDQQNYQVILDNLERLSADTDPADAKQWVINDLRVSDINVVATVRGLAAENQTVRVRLPEIVLTDVRSESLAELQGQVIKQVLGAVIQQAGGQLPGLILTELSAGVARIGDLGQATLTKVGEASAIVGEIGGELGERIGEVSPEAGEAVDRVGREVGEAAGRVGEEAERAIGEATRGLGGLLGGNREQDDEAPAEEEQATE